MRKPVLFNIHKIRTKLILTYAIIFIIILMSILSLSIYTLNKRYKKELLRSDTEALTQISNSIVLLTDIMVEKMISIYANNDIQWFFQEFSNKTPEEFRNTSVSNYSIAKRLKNVRTVLRQNAMLYTQINGGCTLITNEKAIYTSWSDNKINYSESLTQDIKEWNKYFTENKQSYLWKVVYNRNSMSFKEDPNENTLICLYYYRSVANREKKGFICMSIDTEELFSCYKTYISKELKNNIYIINNMNQLISSSDSAYTEDTIPQDISKAIQNAFKIKKDNISLEDKNYIYNCSFIPSRNWVLINKIPLSYISNSAFYSNNSIIYIFIIGTATACLFVIFYTSHFSRRINYLKNIMKNASSKHYLIKYTPKAHDDFDEIGDSLNNMFDEITHYTKRLVEEEKEKKENEINYLHAQINTHFLYNILNSIKLLSSLNRNQDINTLITSLVRLLKGTLDVSSEMITLEEEIKNVDHYFQIEKIIHLEEIKLKVECSISSEAFLVPKLLLQPIVENCFLHGFNNVTHEKEISIFIKPLNETMLIIKIKDNGCGMTKQQLMSITNYNKYNSHSIGLKNIEDRIKLLFGAEFGIMVDSMENEGTTVTLTIPAGIGQVIP